MKKTILILAANPRQDLDLRREVHILKSVIERSQAQDEFEVKIASNVNYETIQKLFLEYQPRIVHFCGHGAGEQGLVFENEEKSEHLVSNEALADLFKYFANQIECVLLNACYSDVQATEISRHINYVVGMKQAIKDDSAIVFTRGFYQTLAYQKSIEDSYNLGCNAIKIKTDNNNSETSKIERKFINRKTESQNLSEHLKPQLKVKSPLTIFNKDNISTSAKDLPDLTELVQDEINRQQYREDIEADFKLGKNNFYRKETLSKQEYRWRQMLLSKVKQDWIKGFLEKSLFSQVLFEQEIINRSDTINLPFSELEEFAVESNQSFEFIQASDIFEGMGAGRTLLILGEPGTGKTISLLKLAERLIKKTEADFSLPIPVVFNLSSWAIKRQNISDWLVEELIDKYNISKTLGKKWIEQEYLILLLDGLDEVKKEYRNDCVIALNKFLDKYGITETVVCCRVQDYEALSERLKLRNAICIQPLSIEYINWYLDDVGKSLFGLKQLLQKDKELEEFARTPLIFSVMSINYKDYSSEEIFKEIKVKEGRYKRLFDRYIQQMFKHRKIQNKYPEINTKQWLNIIAKSMIQSSQSLFLIENIQPINFFDSRLNYFIYHRMLTLFISIYTITVGIIIGAFVFGQWGSILLGIFYFALTNIFFQIVYVIDLFDKININSHLSKNKIQNLSRNKIQPFFILKFSLTKFDQVLNKSVGLSFRFSLFIYILMLIIISITLFFIAIIAIIFSLATSNIFLLLEVLKGLFVGLIELIPSILIAFFSTFISSTFYSIPFLLIIEAGETIQETKLTNQGIWKSLNNSFIVLLLILLIFIFIGGLLGLILGNSVVGGIKLGLFFGGFFGCLLSLVPGFACIQHFVLRLILYFKNKSPWNYSQFLDSATESLFMQKVGGGYIFIHRMLMEHFANMKLD